MDVLRGATAGVGAAMAMSALRAVTTRLGLVEKTPPEAIATEGVPRLLRRIPPERRGLAIELAHWSYGAAGGVAYAALPRRIRSLRGAGSAYGVGAWLLFEVAVAPGLGLRHAREFRPVERAALLADHLLYGTIVARALD